MKDVNNRRGSLRRALTATALLCVAATGAAGAVAGQSAPFQAERASSVQPSTDSPADIYSIQRIRSGLRRRPGIRLSKPDRELPVFRARIEGYQFTLPSWKDRFVMRTAPEPLGGADFARARWAAIAPVAWGSPTPFAGVGPEGGAGPGLLDLPALLLDKALQAYANRATVRARAEVRRELAEVEAHNLQVAAGLPDAGSAAKTATVDKKPGEKKQADKQEPKKHE